MIAEEGAVFVAAVQCGLEKAADHHAAEAALLLTIDEGIKSQPTPRRAAVVLLVPHRVPLAMIGAVHPDRALELGAGTGVAETIVLDEAREARYIAVMRAVNDEVVVVAHRCGTVSRGVLAVHRRDGHERLDGEIEVEGLRGVVGVGRQPIEGAGNRHRFAAARVPHERDARHVDLAEERLAGRVVEGAEHLEVLEQHPAAGIILAAERTVEEVLVDRGEDEAA